MNADWFFFCIGVQEGFWRSLLCVLLLIKKNTVKTEVLWNYNFKNVFYLNIYFENIYFFLWIFSSNYSSLQCHVILQKSLFIWLKLKKQFLLLNYHVWIEWCIFHFFRSSCVVKVAGLVFFNPLSDIRHDLPLPLIQKHLRVVPSADSALEQDCSSVTSFVSVSPHRPAWNRWPQNFYRNVWGFLQKSSSHPPLLTYSY